VAQVRFRELSEKWHSASAERRQQLEGPLRRYLEEFPYDAPRRRAWIYLAWILVHKGELLEARELIDRVQSGPPGSVSDFAVVTEAALLLELNQPREALRLLRPVRSQLIDPVERSLANEAMVVAAMSSEAYAEALIYMVDWGAGAPVTERAAVRESITSHLHRTPRKYLERALVDSSASDAAERDVEPARREQEEWQREATARRLTAIAVEERDPDLARFVLDRSDVLGRERDAARDLLDLATSNESKATVRGRTLGLLLTTETPEQRRRSSEVTSAVAAALGLPRSSSEPGAVRVVFAQDGGGAAGATTAFKNLGLQGAAIVIGGFDSTSAQHHSWQAERNGIPVLLLHPHELARPVWSHTLGVSLASQRELLADDLRSRGLFRSRLLEPDDELCRNDSPRNVASRLQTWAQEGSDSVVFLANRDCAETLLEVNGRSKRPLPIGLGLEGAAAFVGEPGQVVALGAGSYPFSEATQELDPWLERNGRSPSWFEALGHDAALLSDAVLQKLPVVDLEQSSEVSAHSEAVRVALGRTEIPVWTATTANFDASLTLQRAFTFQGDASALGTKAARRSAAQVEPR
jgi:hypothetical protein